MILFFLPWPIMTKWQAIVFDLDDTLYSERDYVFSGFQAVAAWAEVNLGIPACQGIDEFRRLFEQGVRNHTFNHWLAAHNRNDEHLVQKLIEVYREHQPMLIPFPETPMLLASLRRSYRLGLVSDGYLAVQQRKWAALNLACYFDAVIFSDQWGREAWKPSVKPFEAVLQQLKADAPAAVYVADNPTKDFLGARQVGLFTIRVCWPGGEYTHLHPPEAKYAPDLTIASLTELDRVFANK